MKLSVKQVRNLSSSKFFRLLLQEKQEESLAGLVEAIEYIFLTHLVVKHLGSIPNE